jgi:hypothetical protein
MGDRAIGQRRALEAVHVRDVGVIEGGKHAGLAFEPSQALGILGERRGQDLDGGIAMERRIPGAEDLTHAARANRRYDFLGAHARSSAHAVRHCGR